MSRVYLKCVTFSIPATPTWLYQKLPIEMCLMSIQTAASVIRLQYCIKRCI